MQLDFIGNAITNQTNNATEQSNFWDSGFNLIPARRPSLNTKKVDAFFNSILDTEIVEYSKYWNSVAPKNVSEIFQRWLFAFMSVHTSWRSNVTGYLAIRNWWEWLNNNDELERRIIASGAGLHKNRTKFISTFAQAFWTNPDFYVKQEDETWVEFRDKLVDATLGLGMAKVSFSIEMVYSQTAEVTCMDTHLFQLFGLDQTKDSKQYHAMEQHWIEMCKMWNVSSYVARCIWWDRNQGYTDSRYWSFCLE
jgi:hypothetical protein